MSEKVLGFKEKDVCFGNMWMYHIQKDKLVPVVSVEELERFCEEKESAVGLGKETRGFMLGRDCILKSLRQFLKQANQKEVKE